MRASYDTLFAKVIGVLNQDPYAGHLFVFINSRRNCIKCLFWDGTGLVLLCKLINEGLFYKINPIHKGEVILSPAEFALFFEGADLEKRVGLVGKEGNRTSAAVFCMVTILFALIIL